jgi:hypothetical protein
MRGAPGPGQIYIKLIGRPDNENRALYEQNDSCVLGNLLWQNLKQTLLSKDEHAHFCLSYLSKRTIPS